MNNESGVEPTGQETPKVSRPIIWGAAAVALVIGIAAYSNSESKWSDDAPKTIAANADDDAPTVEKKQEALVEPDVRGVIKPKQESTIASKLTSRIVSMPFDKGQSFRRGAMLASFDCSAIRAQLNAANAASNAYRTSYNTNVELDQYEAIGKNDVAVSKANLGKAQAEAQAVKAQLSDCAVYAPFSGTVVEQIGHRGEIAASGQPLLKIQSGGDLEVELIVPSNWLTWLRPGAPFAFKIDETGATISGAVTQLGASVDPVSKTIRVMGSVGQSDSLVLPGMSGSATFDKAARTNAAGTTASKTGQAATPNGRKPS